MTAPYKGMLTAVTINMVMKRMNKATTRVTKKLPAMGVQHRVGFSPCGVNDLMQWMV